MIDFKTLKDLVLEAFSANPYKPIREVIPDVERLAAFHDVFPSRKDCQWYDVYHNYYGMKRLSPTDKKNVNHIIWQLIRENLFVIGKDRLN